MPRRCRPVSPVPEGPAGEDQLQTCTRLRLEEEATKVGLFLAKSGRRFISCGVRERGFRRTLMATANRLTRVASHLKHRNWLLFPEPINNERPSKINNNFVLWLL